MHIAVVQLAIDIVLDDRNVALGEQFDECLLAFVRHLEAERILEIRHDHAGSHGPLVEQAGQRLHVDAFHGVRRHLHGAHA
ncbi:hypothetical protein D3C87_1400080 [compost metagenome]